jgi:hypothetical protein
MESWMMDLLVQVVAGAVGGTGAGTILKDLSLGKPGDAISGAVGGGIVGQILNSVLGGGGEVGDGCCLRGQTSSAAASVAPW